MLTVIKENKKILLLTLLAFLVISVVIFSIDSLIKERINTTETQSQEVIPKGPDLDVNVVGTENACFLEFEVKEVPKEIDATIEKNFKNTGNENLPSTYEIKSNEKIIVYSHIVNTGNTDLNDLVVKDPLSDEFANFGAKNLNLIKFSEFLANPQSVCSYSSQGNFVQCILPNLAPQATFDFSFVVSVNSDLPSDATLVNVVRLNNTTDSILKYSSDTLKTPKEEDTHAICKDKACVRVAGSGSDECTKDSQCVYSVCSNRMCVRETCEDGDCDSECDSDSDCKEETHLECVSNTCKRVEGEGKNSCVDNSDCYSTHTKCSNASCITVSGKGTNDCSTDLDCRISPTVYTVPSTGTPLSAKLLFTIYFPTLLFALSFLFRSLRFKR